MLLCFSVLRLLSSASKKMGWEAGEEQKVKKEKEKRTNFLHNIVKKIFFLRKYILM